MAPKSNKVKDDKLKTPNFKLPLVGGKKKWPGSSPSVLFTGNLRPSSKAKRYSYNVNVQPVVYYSPKTWSINGSNLPAHFESNYRSVFNKLVRVFPPLDLVKMMPPPDLAKAYKNKDLYPCSKYTNTKAITVYSIFTNSLEKRLSSMTLDEAKSAVFDTETYKILFLEYLMANDLPFAHADSPALAALLAYARRCDSVELPTVNRQSIRAAPEYNGNWLMN